MPFLLQESSVHETKFCLCNFLISAYVESGAETHACIHQWSSYLFSNSFQCHTTENNHCVMFEFGRYNKHHEFSVLHSGSSSGEGFFILNFLLWDTDLWGSMVSLQETLLTVLQLQNFTSDLILLTKPYVHLLWYILQEFIICFRVSLQLNTLCVLRFYVMCVECLIWEDLLQSGCSP